MPESAPEITEFAGHTGFHSFDPSHPTYPLQLDACVDWNADTGATSHMTPHRHWLRNYSVLHMKLQSHVFKIQPSLAIRNF